MLGFKSVPGDPFYNRRRFAVILFLYVVIWGCVIAALRVFDFIDSTDLGVLLAYVTPISGLGFHHYFKASTMADRECDEKDR